MKYLVKYEIVIDARSPQEAAREAMIRKTKKVKVRESTYGWKQPKTYEIELA